MTEVASEAQKDSRQGSDRNPWYLLATLYGEPNDSSSSSLQDSNRIAWNRLMFTKLRKEELTELQNSGRFASKDLVELDADGMRNVETLFEKRKGKSVEIKLSNLLRNDVDFSNTIFDKDINLRNFYFPRASKFNNAKFTGDVIFREVTFAGYVWFEDAIFDSRTSFKRSVFSGNAAFKRSVFSHLVDFSGATFSAGATFNDTCFFSETLFWETTWSEDVSFEGVSFLGPAYFNMAVFGSHDGDEAGFLKATFSENVMFDHATISGSARFGDVTFSGEAHFSDVTFGGHTSFVGAKFCSEVLFVNAEMKRPTLFVTSFETHPPDFSGAKLHEGTSWYGAKWPNQPKDADQAVAFIRAYERLKLEMDRLKKHEDELNFFVLEMQARRVLLGGWEGLPLTLFELLCDYGRSYMKPLGGIFIVVVPGALPFWYYFGPFKLKEAVGLSLANTFGAFGFRKDFIESAVIEALPSVLKVYAGAQSIAGAVLLFLFGLALRNRFRMK